MRCFALPAVSTFPSFALVGTVDNLASLWHVFDSSVFSSIESIEIEGCNSSRGGWKRIRAFGAELGGRRDPKRIYGHVDRAQRHECQRDDHKVEHMPEHTLCTFQREFANVNSQAG